MFEDRDTRKAILFVDDEQDILDGLRCMLHNMRDEWDMTFVESATQALSCMERRHFDVIVTDMLMPGMDGAQLLNEIMRLYPSTIRFVLSGYSDKETILKSIGPTHQFLAKPCDSARLKSAIRHALILRGAFDNPAIKQIIAQLKNLPGIPGIYNEIVAVLSSNDPSIERIAKIVERDMSMSAQVLHLVNSAFFGIRRRVSNITQAISLIGVETLRSLVLMTGVFTSFKSMKRLPGFSFTGLMRHALTVGIFARIIVEQEKKDGSYMDHAFMAGLLHDVGKMIFAANMPDAYGEVLDLVRKTGQSFAAAEAAIFNVSHAEAGAYLLGLWGLPDTILEAVAYHHHPDKSPTQKMNTLTVVHMANVLDHVQQTENWDDETFVLPINMTYLTGIGMEQHVPRWRRACNDSKFF